MLGLRLRFKSSHFSFLFFLRSLNSAGESVEEGESGLGNQKLRLFFLRTGEASLRVSPWCTVRTEMLRREHRKGGKNAGAADDRLGAMGEGGEEINRSD